MAKGFITLENGEDFYSRWTGYDAIIQIAINELANFPDGKELSSWLRTIVPREGEEKGDAVFFNRNGEMIQRILDLRGLTADNRAMFWRAIRSGATKLNKLGKKYSDLNPDLINELIDMHEKVFQDVRIEKILDEFIIVNGDEVKKIGPGWGNGNVSK